MADNTKFVSLGKKTLTRFLSTSATTLYANNLNFDKDGTRVLAQTDLGDYGWITLEPRSKANRELCKVTAISGNTLTIARGFKPFAPYDQDTAMWAKPHEAGTSFVFSNAPQMYDEFAVKDNDETITGTWTFDEDTRPKLDADLDSAVNEELVTFGQLYRTAISGGVDASTSAKGITKLSTAPASATNPIAVGDNDSRVPTSGQTALLAAITADAAEINKLDGMTATQAQLNEAGVYFGTTKTQNNKVTMTAGHALSAGELVAVESDGKVYRTRPKQITKTNATTTTSSAEELGTSGKALLLSTPTDTKKIWIGRDSQSTAYIDMYLVTLSGLYESATVASTSLSSADGTFYDAIMDGDTLLAAYRLSGGTTRLIAVTDADGTPSAGSELNMATGDGGAVCTTATASTYIGFSNVSSNLVAYKITRSGNTLTNAASATLVSGAMTPVAARNFEGTNFILVVYLDGTSFKAVVGEYNTTTGAWTSVGTPITISTNSVGSNHPVFIEMLSSTQALVVWQGASDMQGRILTRATVELTQTSEVSLIASVVSSGGHCSMNKATDRHYFLSAETTSGGKAQIIELDRDYESVATLGSAVTYGTGSNEGVAVGLVTPTRTLAVYQTSTDSFFSVADLTTNLDGTVGFVESDVETDATEEVITSDYVSGLSGLTAGTQYNIGLNGEVTSSALGTLPVSATTLSPIPKVKPILKALSSTTGIKI